MPISTAVDASAIARIIGIKTEFVPARDRGLLLLPQHLGVVGQGSDAATYSSAPLRITSAQQASTVYGLGSPIHLAALELLPISSSGVGTVPVTIYPLQAAGGAAPSVGAVAPVGVATVDSEYRVLIGGVLSAAFTVLTIDAVAAITAKMTVAINTVLEMPVIAVDGTTDVDLTSKWSGSSANGISLEVVGSTTAGVTFGITAMAGGLVNPDVDLALANVGTTWITMMVNLLEIDDAVNLARYETFAEGRWGAIIRKPLVVFTGNTEEDVTLAVAVPDANANSRVLSQLVAPDSKELPFVVAAAEIVPIIVIANNSPASGYALRSADSVAAGADSEQWTFVERDLAVKAGSSTVEVRDGVVHISDVVTFHHPSGNPLPEYRYVRDIVVLQNILFGLDLIFESPEWAGAPLIPDTQITSSRNARKPMHARAAVARLIDDLGLGALISNPEAAKAGVVAGLSATNPNRLDVKVPVQISGTINIISVDLCWSRNFGTNPIV